MLCLSRKPNEDIVIDGRILVRVIRLEGGRVILGVEAPRDMPVHRGEVWEEIVEEWNDGSLECPTGPTKP